MVSKSLAYSTVYPKVNYFHKFEDHIGLKNVKLEFLDIILSMKTMINRTFFFLNPFPPMKREVTLSVAVYGNYQYVHQVASHFRREKAVKFNCLWY